MPSRRRQGAKPNSTDVKAGVFAACAARMCDHYLPPIMSHNNTSRLVCYRWYPSVRSNLVSYPDIQLRSARYTPLDRRTDIDMLLVSFVISTMDYFERHIQIIWQAA
eukprot:1190954-Prorocentrum_minimum.AAC.1